MQRQSAYCIRCRLFLNKPDHIHYRPQQRSVAPTGPSIPNTLLYLPNYPLLDPKHSAIMRVPIPLVALIASSGINQAAAAPVTANSGTTGQKAPCKAVPNAFWTCESDCLYKQCGANNAACLRGCEAACSKFFPARKQQSFLH